MSICLFVFNPFKTVDKNKGAEKLSDMYLKSQNYLGADTQTETCMWLDFKEHNHQTILNYFNESKSAMVLFCFSP